MSVEVLLVVTSCPSNSNVILGCAHATFVARAAHARFDQQELDLVFGARMTSRTGIRRPGIK